MSPLSPVSVGMLPSNRMLEFGEVQLSSLDDPLADIDPTVLILHCVGTIFSAKVLPGLKKDIIVVGNFNSGLPH